MSELDALQATLADEHAALYTYGVLGARTSQAASPTLFDALTTGYRRHRARRDQLRLYVLDAGAEPVAAEVAYVVDDALQQPAQLERAALDLETASTGTLLALVATSSGAVRGWALTEAVWSSTWLLGYGGTPTTWPGAPELDA